MEKFRKNHPEYNNKTYNFEYKEEFQYLTNCCLNITDACNLACRYCFVQQQPHFMSYQTAQDAIDWLYSNYQKKKELNLLNSENEKIGVNFFGGEPTLLFDEIIVPIINYTNNKYPNIFRFGITTNGTLLNENRINFLANNQVRFLLSIDGDKETQDYNRPCQNGQSSFDLLAKNIPLILKRFPQTTFRSTITQPTVKNVFQNYIFAEQQGFTNIFMVANEREKWSEENLEILKLELSKICYYNLLYFLNNQIPPCEFAQLTRAMEKVYFCDTQIARQNKFYEGQKSVFRCGLGTSYGSIAYDGTIYGCQEQDSRSETNDLFNLGNIYTGGINKEKHFYLLNLYTNQGTIYCENKELCNNCKIRLHCISDICPSTTMDLYNNFTTATYTHCIIEQHMVDNIIAIEQILTEQNNEIFMKYQNSILNKGGMKNGS